MVIRKLFGNPESKEEEARFSTCAYAVLARSPKCISPDAIREISSTLKHYFNEAGSTIIDLPSDYCAGCKFYQKKA